jgi:hypothetical protein
MVVNMHNFKNFPQFKNRFLSYLPKNYKDESMIDSCWKCGRSKKSANYTRIKYGNDSYQAHRISYIIFNGPIKSDQVVRHTCDNKYCVNPKHLILGTQADNLRDMVKRNRQAHQKLNEECVKVIKWMLKYKPEKDLALKLARLHNVTPETISAIKRGLSWAWLKV